MRRPLAFLAVLLVAALAGCTGPTTEDPVLPTGQLDKDQYIDAFERSADGLAERYGFTKPASDSHATRVRRVANIQHLVRDWAGRLAGLQPPAEIRAAHDTYVAGLRSFAADLQRPLDELRAGHDTAAKRLLDTGAALSPTTRRELRTSRATYRRLHYDIRNLDAAPIPDT